MAMDDLDNPIHAALRTLHHGIAVQSGVALRYPSAYAPFLAVPDETSDIDDAFDALIAPVETVYLLGKAPRHVRGTKLHEYPPLAQMVCDAPLPAVDGPPIMPLGIEHRDDVLALTAIVYPHYFRPRTMEMGRYYGIYEGGQLAAMIGERLGSTTTREISAVCTHPDCNGRGYARRLMAFLTNDLIASNIQPFLHVSHENERAKEMYERVGFRLRRDIGFWSIRHDS
ncbi:GNAT family N-acetyltransferase [Noviluteimonas dokdonensis]|nr:GNAT family N-acetyltransferase [Lysobacter dokdonensis]